MISAFISNVKTVQTEWPEEAKSSHSEAGYKNPSPDQSRVCQGCVNFIPPNRCKTVKDVDLTGYCPRYERQ